MPHLKPLPHSVFSGAPEITTVTPTGIYLEKPYTLSAISENGVSSLPADIITHSIAVEERTQGFTLEVSTDPEFFKILSIAQALYLVLQDDGDPRECVDFVIGTFIATLNDLRKEVDESVSDTTIPESTLLSKSLAYKDSAEELGQLCGILEMDWNEFVHSLGNGTLALDPQKIIENVPKLDDTRL